VRAGTIEKEWASREQLDTSIRNRQVIGSSPIVGYITFLIRAFPAVCSLVKGEI
jgi:hypothetical protein